MKRAFYPILFSIWLAFPIIGNAQTVTIDPSVQRYIGNVTELHRPTYFSIHDSGSDPDLQTFFNDYNTYPGRQFWGPFSTARNQTGSVGTYPPLQGSNGLLKNVKRGIQTEHPYNTFVDGIDTKAAADWAADYYINRVPTPPEFFEPMNEPFVHTGDYGSDAQDIKRQMSELFRDIGNKFHNTPELANMKVIGYSAAWASLELWDFGHWEQNQKLFMDIAGADMDAFATHLYDGVNVVGQSTRRSGSNSDAILDLIETYSFTKWGVIKPHALTEYGAIEEGYGDNYSDLASIQSVRSQNHLLFGFLEREDRMAITIPFNTGKARWHITPENNYQPYQPATWKPSNIGQPNPTGWVYTPRIEFYELWKEVKGKRVKIQTDNPDIQVQAFVDGTKLFVALNNLDDHPQNVDLDIAAGLPGLQNVRIKTLKIYPDIPYAANDITQTTAPSNIPLVAGETAVLEYTFSSNITFANTIRSRNYYTSKHLQSISANTPISFTFNGVEPGTGYAKLKMAIGRKHNVSKTPLVTVNGIAIPVPTNIKGYDQANRSDFFGTIDIPVPMELIQANNTVTFTFPDNGGRLASVILNVERYDNAQMTQGAYPGVTPLAIPAIIEAENYDTGGEGIAYHDTDAVNTGGQYRSQNGVDINTSAAASYFVSSAVAGEWMEYSIDVPGQGEFQLQATVSSGDAAGSIRFEFDGVDKSGSVAIPATGEGTWTTINESVVLAGGRQVMRVVIESGNLSIDQFNIASLVPVSGIAISVDTLVTSVEKTAPLEASVLPSYAAIQTFTWSSANAAIAEVDDNGLVTGIAEGETTLYATSDDGGYQDSVRVIVAPKRIESATFTEPVPAFIYSGDDVTFSVDYVADSARDIAIELYTPGRTQWLGLTRTTVQEGTGAVALTISRNEPLPPGTGYRLSASIRPVGTDWRQIIASEAILFDVVERETIDFVALPTQMTTAGSLDFDISYTSNEERDVFVELYTPDRIQWLGAKRMTVPAGKDTVTLTINLPAAPAPAAGYDLGCALRVVGGDWTTTIVGRKALLELTDAGPQNLVQNPGFETGDFSGWWPQDKEIVTNEVFDGSYAAKITGGNVGQAIDVKPSATYDISIANKLVSGNDAGLVFQTIPGYKWLKTIDLENPQWTESRSSITIPDTLDRINVFISGPAGNVVLVDNVSLVEKIPVTGIVITPASLEVQVSDSSALAVTLTPENASNQGITWSTDNSTVATVDENGVVAALALGKAAITATAEDGGLQAICNVTVGTVVNLTKNSGFETGDFTAWNDRSAEIVTEDIFEGAYSTRVNSTGAISQVINVKPSTTYVLSGASKIIAGPRGDLAVQTWPARQWLKTIAINTAEWTEKSTAFTVPEGVEQVNVYVYMPTGSAALTDNITLVEHLPPTAIELTPGEIVLEAEEKSQLTVSFIPTDAQNLDLRWVSADPTIAQVDENGQITALKRGKTMVIATSLASATVADTVMVEVWQQSPFNHHTVPGIIELEDFDEGGQGIAYHDNTPGNSGNTYRNESVDIEPTDDQSGTYHITGFQPGEWLEYEIDVLADGDYYLYLRAVPVTSSAVKFEIESLNIAHQLDIPAGDVTTWGMFSLADALSLPVGKHILKLTALGGEFQLNFLEIEAISLACQEAEAWDPRRVYNEPGAEVLFGGKRYINTYSSQGDMPGQGGPWKLAGHCGAATLDCYNTTVWSAQATYPTAGFQVVHNGMIYTSQWFASPGREPGVSDVWKLEGPCTTSSLSTPPSSCPSVAPWVDFAIYNTAGIEVTHMGMLYTSQWYAAAGEEPGMAAVWKPLGPCTPVYEMSPCPTIAQWDEALVYSAAGTEVLHNKAVFTNRYYASAGLEPGIDDIWEYQYSCVGANTRYRTGTPGLANEPKAELKMYPNPSNGAPLTIEIFTHTDYTLTIFNAQGALVFEKNSHPTAYLEEISLENNLKKGVYYVTLLTEHGKLTRKLVVN